MRYVPKSGDMSDAKHIVCPSCSATNRLPADKLGRGPKCGKCGDRLFSGTPAVLTDANFEKHVSRSDVPVVVDFWAPWCGPCKMMAPQFEQAAKELEPGIRFAKLNTDEAQGTAAFQYSEYPDNRTIQEWARGGATARGDERGRYRALGAGALKRSSSRAFMISICRRFSMLPMLVSGSKSRHSTCT